jgi:hypothetical protein
MVMTRSGMTRVVGAFEAAACVAVTLSACLSGETINLGTNYEAPPPERDATSMTPPEAGVEAAADDVSPDDGSLDALDGLDTDAEGEADAPLTGASICIPNPSFETFSADAGPSPLLTNPIDWQVCSSTTANPQACTLPPMDGNSYLALDVGLAPFLFNPAYVDSTLCEPLQAGVTYMLALDLALDAPQSDASPPGEPPALQLRGSNSACDLQADLLVRFSGATNTCGWKSLCATFVPQQSYTHLVLIPEATSSTGLVYSQTNVLVDNLTSGGTCARR